MINGFVDIFARWRDGAGVVGVREVVFERARMCSIVAQSRRTMDAALEAELRCGAVREPTVDERGTGKAQAVLLAKGYVEYYLLSVLAFTCCGFF